jgi:4-amino-4-deoxy-L-arabinose transferase-like glycosyltransferase
MSRYLKDFPRQAFLFLLVMQLVTWTVIPTLTRLSLPIDAIEGYVWGQHFEWGYDRNPWMNALLTHAAVLIGGKSGWLVYGFSQLFVCLGFYAVWRLTQEITQSETYALTSVLMLIGLQYTSIASVDFNDNVIELGLWPLLSYFAYRAYFSEARLSNRYWILTGIIAGLALMTKYYSIIPILCLFAFGLLTPEIRQKKWSWGFYTGGGLAFLICLPHLIWLPQHHFITIQYALGKTHEFHETSTATSPFLLFLSHHFYYALRFGFVQLMAFIGPLLLLAIGVFPRDGDKYLNPSTLPSSTLIHRFLHFAVLWPFLVTLLLSMVLGWKLNIMWGTPLLSLWPLWFLVQFRPSISRQGLYRLSMAALIVFCLFALFYAIHNLRDQNSKHNLNGQAYSDAVTQAFFAKYHRPLTELSGDRYLNGYVAFYADHPIDVKFK